MNECLALCRDICKAVLYLLLVAFCVLLNFLVMAIICLPTMALLGILLVLFFIHDQLIPNLLERPYFF